MWPTIFDLLNRFKILRPIEAVLVHWFDFSIVSRAQGARAGAGPVPTFTLTTVGRTSGDLISTPLFYFREDDDYFVIGSKGGNARHPVWWLNLQPDPRAWIRLHRRRLPVRADLVAGDDRARIWQIAVQAYPFYADYEEKAAPREIPVVRLTPGHA